MHQLTHQAQTEVPLIPLDRKGLADFAKQAGAVTRNQCQVSKFSGDHGQSLLIHDADGKAASVLVGTEKRPKDPRATLHQFATLAQELPPGPAYRLADGFDGEQAALGWGLGAYRFDRYLKRDAEPGPELVLPESVDLELIGHQLDAIFLARDLINTPAGDLGPQDLCNKAREVAAECGADLSIIEGEDLPANNYPAIYAVGMGSHRPPALIDLRWGDEAHPRLTLVGKGVVFDSGGLDIKPAAGMLLMKKDMGGAAVTMALARLVMKTRLPVRLRLLIPAVENAVGPEAYRPGDVVQTRRGKTVEIGNTDAEGRMILCDALAEAVTEEPDLLIDMATLTGAARVAMGQDVPPFWTEADDIAEGLASASRASGDPIWRLPLWHPYLEDIKSPIADLNNISASSFGGAIIAAIFLHQFVEPFHNWVHFDIYGWRQNNIPGTPKGAEANALRAVYHYLATRYPRT